MLTTSREISRRVCMLLAVVAIGYFLLLPLGMLFVGALRTSPYGTAGEWTLAGFATVLKDPRTLPTLLATVFYALVTTLACMALGLWFVTVSTRMATHLARLLTPAMVVLVVTPRLFYALSWGMLGNPNSGLFARALHMLGLSTLPDWFTVYSWGGLLAVTALKLTAFAYLLMYGPACRVDRSLEDAALIAGVHRPRAFIDITLGTLRPAMLAASMLIFVDVMQVFDLPAVLGMPAGIHTLALRVNDYLLESGKPNWAAANALSLVFVAIIAVLLMGQRAVTRGRSFVTISGKAAGAARAAVGRWRWAVDASIVSFILVAILLPIAQIVIGSFQPFFGLYGVWTTANYESLLDDPLARRTLVVTLGIAVGGGLVTVLAAFGMAYLIQRRGRSTLARLSRAGSWVPACAPGIVLSLALLWSYLNTPGLKQLFGTPWLMLLALIVGSIPIGVRAVEGVIAQVSPEVEEVARTCGASSAAAVFGITGRLCAPALLAAWFLVGLAISGTLDIPLLLQSTESQTVATLAYSMYTYGHVPQAAALYCLYLVFALGVVGIAVLIGFGGRAMLVAGRRQAVLHARG